MNLNLINITKNILLQHSQKHVSGWCQKKHLHCTISRNPKHLEIKCLYIPVNLLENICSKNSSSRKNSSYLPTCFHYIFSSFLFILFFFSSVDVYYMDCLGSRTFVFLYFCFKDNSPHFGLDILELTFDLSLFQNLIQLILCK